MAELTPAEIKALEMAQSIERMSSEIAWKRLLQVQAAEEAKAIAALEVYLDEEAHPDREELMTLALRWYAIRKNRKLWEQQVEEAREYKDGLRKGLLADLLQNPSPVSDPVRELLMEEM